MLKSKKAQHHKLCSTIETLHFHKTVTHNTEAFESCLSSLLKFSEALSKANKMPEGREQDDAIASAYAILL